MSIRAVVKGKAVAKLWESCGKAVGKLWKSCRKAAEKLGAGVQQEYSRSTAGVLDLQPDLQLFHSFSTAFLQLFYRGYLKDI